MVIHLVASRYNLTASIDRLRSIVKAVHEEESTIAYDWLEPSYISQVKKREKHTDTDWAQVHNESVEAIAKADLVIADASVRSFSVGYQVATALQMKKPTLVLMSAEEAEVAFFAKGIVTGVTYKECTDDLQIEDAVKDFLKDNDIQTKDMRFNFFIDRPIYNYLRWSAMKTGKTKAEILRELVLKEINKDKEGL